MPILQVLGKQPAGIAAIELCLIMRDIGLVHRIFHSVDVTVDHIDAGTQRGGDVFALE